MDRNKDNADTVKAYTVALRKESVDRNYSNTSQIGDSKQSLSARRAWIEIFLSVFALGMPTSSLSARRAWIEISAAVIASFTVLRRSPQGERG